MIDYKGKFIYEKDNQIIEAPVYTCDLQSNLVLTIIKIEDNFRNLIYRKSDDCWLISIKQTGQYNYSDEPTYERFKYKVVKFEWTTIIA